jgi:hypothetical protein
MREMKPTPGGSRKYLGRIEGSSLMALAVKDSAFVSF